MTDKDRGASKQGGLGMRADQNDVEVEKVKRARCSKIGLLIGFGGGYKGVMRRELEHRMPAKKKPES